jgi:Tfp pilus assembly protein FimV
MSTLSISPTQVPTDVEPDVDTRFDALVRFVVPAQRASSPDFETVFDLDYGQPVEEPMAPVVQLRRQPQKQAQLQTQPQARRRVRKPAPAHVRLTRRGRVALTFAFLTVALALMIPFGGWATATLTGGTPEPVRIVEVQPGDTLYGIAGDLAEPGHVREMVNRIQELNSLPGGQINAGQKLAVPRG